MRDLKLSLVVAFFCGSLLTGCDTKKREIQHLVESEILKQCTQNSTAVNLKATYKPNVTITQVSGLDFTGTGTVICELPDLYLQCSDPFQLTNNPLNDFSDDYRNAVGIDSNAEISEDILYLSNLEREVTQKLCPALILFHKSGYTFKVIFPSLDGRLSGSSVQLNSQNAAPTIDMGTNPKLLNAPNITTINTNSTLKSLPNTYATEKDFLNVYRMELNSLITQRKSKLIQDRNDVIKSKFDRYIGPWISNQTCDGRVTDEQNLPTSFKLQINADKSCFGELKNQNQLKGFQGNSDVNTVYFEGAWLVSGNGIKVIANPYKWVSKNLITNSVSSNPEIQTRIKHCATNAIAISFIEEKPSYQNNSKSSFLLMNAGDIKNLEGDSIGITTPVRAIKVATPLQSPVGRGYVASAQAPPQSISPSGNSTAQNITPSTLSGSNLPSVSGGPRSITPSAPVPQSIVPDTTAPQSAATNNSVPPADPLPSAAPKSIAPDTTTPQIVAVNNPSLPTGPSASGGAHSIATDTTVPQSVTPDNSQPSTVTGQVAAPQSAITDNSISQSNPQDSLAAQDEALQKLAKLNHQSADTTPNTNSGGKRNDEIFPQTRTLPMDSNEISLMNKAKLRYAINEMFARYGLVFKNQSIQRQFEKSSWYHPNPDIKQEEILRSFTPIEAANLKALIEAEKSAPINPLDVNSTLSSTLHKTSKIKVYSPKDKFPPDIVGSGVAGSFVVIGESVGGGTLLCAAEDALFTLTARKFIVQNKTTGFAPGTLFDYNSQYRLKYSPASPLIIIQKGPLPGFYTVKSP